MLGKNLKPVVWNPHVDSVTDAFLHCNHLTFFVLVSASKMINCLTVESTVI